MSINKQVNKTKTKLVRIDAGIHKLLKIYAAKKEETLRSVIEGCLGDILRVDNEEVA